MIKMSQVKIALYLDFCLEQTIFIQYLFIHPVTRILVVPVRYVLDQDLISKCSLFV